MHQLREYYIVADVTTMWYSVNWYIQEIFLIHDETNNIINKIMKDLTAIKIVL